MNKLFFFFTFLDLYQNTQLTGEIKVNVTLLVVAIITSVMGSSVQVAHTNLEKKIRFAEVFAIYISGIFVAYFSYELGYYYNSFALTGVSSAILSYISIEFILTFKNSVIFVLKAVTKKLPDVIVEVLRNLITPKK